MIARLCRGITAAALLTFSLYWVALDASARDGAEDVSPVGREDSLQTEQGTDGGFMDLITLDGPLDPVTVAFIEKRVLLAEREGARLLLIQLDTPGALATDASELTLRIASSRVPIAIWVGPGGGRAESAGMALLVAAHFRAVSPVARIGKSEPRDLRRPIVAGDGEELASLASMRLVGAPASSPISRFAYESSQGFTLLGEDAAAMGVVDFVAPTLGDALVGLDGLTAVLSPQARREGSNWVAGPLESRVVRTARVVEGPNGELKREPAVQVRFFRLSIVDRVLHSAASPSVAYFLLLAGITLIAFELFTVGVGIVGLAGGCCIALAGHGLTVVGPQWSAIALFVVAFAMFASEIQEGVRGVRTAAAFVLLAAGLLLLRTLPPAPLRLPVWLVILYLTLFGICWRPGMLLMVRSRFWAPAVDREFLVGREVEVKEPLNPRGTVRLGKGSYAARAAGTASLFRGARGVVKEISGSDLVISEISENYNNNN